MRLLHPPDAAAASPPQEVMGRSRYGMPTRGNISLRIVDTRIPASWAKQNLYLRYTISPGHLMAHGLLLPATIIRCSYGTQRQVITSSPIAVIPTGRQQWRGHLMDYVLPRQAMTGRCMSGRPITVVSLQLYPP